MLCSSEVKEYWQDLTKTNMWNRNYIYYINCMQICIQKWNCAEKKFFNGKLEHHVQCTFKCMWWHLQGKLLGLCTTRSRWHFLFYIAVLWHIHCKFKEMTVWLQLNGSTKPRFYVATDAVLLLFMGMVRMFCTSKFNTPVLSTPYKLTNKILHNLHILYLPM